MSVEMIEAEKLRAMSEEEGLILQGCGGDPQEWLDGINDMLTDAGILRKSLTFQNLQMTMISILD